jgi:hypothetical protein
MRRSIPSRFTILVMVLSAGCNSNSKPAVPEKPREIATWAPDPALLDQLGPYVDVEGFQVRPPKGYAPIRAPRADPRWKYFGWSGKIGRNWTAPRFLIGIATAPANDNLSTPESILEQSLLGIRRDLSLAATWEQSVREHGRINELKFLRTRWSGETPKKLKMHGVVYSGRDGSQFIQIASIDSEPNDGSSLKLADAAAATFKRK